MRAKTSVPPFGNPKAPYIIVGEQPGPHEVKRRQLGIGETGDIMNNCLDHALIMRSNIYLTNIFKDRDYPLDHYLVKPKKQSPYLTKLGESYKNYLYDELKDNPTKLIIAMGDAALFALTGQIGIMNWRGSIIPSTLFPDKKVIPILPFWTVIRTYTNNLLINFDLTKAREFIEGFYIPTHRDLMINPSFKEVVDFLSSVYERGIRGAEIGYDIEVNNYKKPEIQAGLHPQVSCMSLSIGLQSMSIPFINARGDYFLADQELEIWRMIAMILEDERISKVAQNSIFDTQFLLRRYGIKCRNIHDTMIAQHLLMPDYSKGLHFITSLWTDHPYYKDDGKEFLGGGSNWDKFYTYNATDSVICTEALPKQLYQIEKLGNSHIYDAQRKLIEPLTFMMERGIKCNASMMHEKYLELEAEENKIQDEIDEEVGFHCNPRSSIAMKKYFVDTLKLKPYRTYDKGKFKDSYDEDSLKRYARRGYVIAYKMLKVRRLRKLRSTYCNINKIDPDGRMRCAYDPTGTRYSRLSSKETIFKTGMNLQNWPKELRVFMSPDKWFAYYPIDLSQAENRIVAYVGKIHPMIHAFETNKDVHELTTRLILTQMYGLDTAKGMDVKSKSPLGDGSHDWRHWGKKANHGFNYDWGYKAFALKNEIPEKDGKMIYEGYHSAYPEVQGRYHKKIKQQLRQNRTLTNLMGRKTTFYGKLEDSTYKEAYSCIPQGSVGDIINQRGINYIYYNKDDFGPVEILIQVHDELGVQIPLSIGFENHAKILKKICANLEKPLKTDYGLEFVIPASLTIASTLNTLPLKHGGNGIEVGENIPKYGDHELGKILEENWGILNA